MVIILHLKESNLKLNQKISYISGPGCSKLTTSLVNETLKFQTLISQICQYFLLKKCEKLLQCKSFSHFFNKNISVFGYKVVRHLTSRPLNELVKLTMLWTTGPWPYKVDLNYHTVQLLHINVIYLIPAAIFFMKWTLLPGHLTRGSFPDCEIIYLKCPGKWFYFIKQSQNIQTNDINMGAELQVRRGIKDNLKIIFLLSQ